MTYGDTEAIANIHAAGANLRAEIMRTVPGHTKRDAILEQLRLTLLAAMDAADGLRR